MQIKAKKLTRTRGKGRSPARSKALDTIHRALKEAAKEARGMTRDELVSAYVASVGNWEQMLAQRDEAYRLLRQIIVNSSPYDAARIMLTLR